MDHWSVGNYATSTLPETNITPKNGWLEDYFLCEMAYFQWSFQFQGVHLVGKSVDVHYQKRGFRDERRSLYLWLVGSFIRLVLVVLVVAVLLLLLQTVWVETYRMSPGQWQSGML